MVNAVFSKDGEGYLATSGDGLGPQINIKKWLDMNQYRTQLKF